MTLDAAAVWVITDGCSLNRQGQPFCQSTIVYIRGRAAEEGPPLRRRAELIVPNHFLDTISPLRVQIFESHEIEAAGRRVLANAQVMPETRLKTAKQ